MLTLKWRARAGQFGQIVTVSCERGSPLEEHTHEYPEIFWIEEGPCLHRINGTRERLETGDLVFIRAHDRHQFISLGRRRFTMTNLECHPQLVADIQRRHSQPFAEWFEHKRDMPFRHRLGIGELRQLKHMALDYVARSPDALHTEALLLDLVRLLESSSPLVSGLANCPDWLRSALLKAKEREVFIDGVAGLVRVTGRSGEHVARSCRKHLGQAPTQILESYRMAYAERCLRLTADPVTEIAYACGYATTTPFYRAFRRHYKQPPLAYRRWLRGG